jgi:hypothetical protein
MVGFLPAEHDGSNFDSGEAFSDRCYPLRKVVICDTSKLVIRHRQAEFAGGKMRQRQNTSALLGAKANATEPDALVCLDHFL